MVHIPMNKYLEARMVLYVEGRHIIAHAFFNSTAAKYFPVSFREVGLFDCLFRRVHLNAFDDF